MASAFTQWSVMEGGSTRLKRRKHWDFNSLNQTSKNIFNRIYMVWKKYCSIIPREIILECNCDLMILSFIESAKKLSSTIKNYSLNQKVLGLPFFFFLSFFFFVKFQFFKILCFTQNFNFVNIFRFYLHSLYSLFFNFFYEINFSFQFNPSIQNYLFFILFCFQI